MRNKSFRMQSFKLIEVEESETFVIHGMATAKIRAGKKIFNLSAGEPIVRTSKTLSRAVSKALTAGDTHYPPVAGTPALRTAAAEWMNKDFKARYKAENTVVVSGGKFGIYLLLQALLRPGDEVLIITPYWVSYPSMVKIFKGAPKILKTTPQSGWKITPQAIKRHATKRSKILIINNGSNPTGALYSKRELQAILAAAAKAGLFVISDEVYSGLTYGTPYVSAASFGKFRDRVAVIQSASKNFAMTGFRIGFVFAPIDLANVVVRLVTQSISGVTTLSQAAALSAIQGRKALTKEINREMKKRRDVFLKTFKREFGYDVSAPESALYVFVPVSIFTSRKISSSTFCRNAMRYANVALVPGSAFGEEGYVRFSFGGKIEVITGGLQALSRWLKLKK